MRTCPPSSPRRLGTLLSVAVLLKLFLTALVRSGARAKHEQLQLPPRLLLLAKRSQGRRAGLGVLGLKQRVSSRSLAQLAFPLMSAKHAITEADDEDMLMPGESAAEATHWETGWQSRRALLAAFSSGNGCAPSCAENDSRSRGTTTTPYSLFDRTGEG